MENFGQAIFLAILCFSGAAFIFFRLKKTLKEGPSEKNSFLRDHKEMALLHSWTGIISLTLFGIYFLYRAFFVL